MNKLVQIFTNSFQILVLKTTWTDIFNMIIGDPTELLFVKLLR